MTDPAFNKRIASRRDTGEACVAHPRLAVTPLKTATNRKQIDLKKTGEDTGERLLGGN